MNKSEKVIVKTQTKEIFIPLEVGFVDIFGIEWHQSQIDVYNKISEDIHDRKIHGFRITEEMLCNRHRVYMLPYLTAKLYKGC